MQTTRLCSSSVFSSTPSGGMPRIVLNQRRGDGENTRGANTRLAERRRSQAVEQLEAARSRIEVLQPFTVGVPQTGLAAGKVVLRFERVTAGYGNDGANWRGRVMLKPVVA